MTTPPHDEAAPFTLLVVCTGNICRSPLAERLLRSRFSAAGVPVTVLSAGTRAMVDDDMTSEASALLSHYGGTPSVHRAQQLTRELVANADLVLTASREHRSEVVSLYPRASRYAYTLAQFARLAAAAEQPVVEEPSVAEERPTKEDASRNAHEKLRDYLVQIAATRGFRPPPVHQHLDDIEDPYRQSEQVYARSGRAIDDAVSTIVERLTTASSRG